MHNIKVLLALTAVFTLASCGGSDGDSSSDGDQPIVEATPAPAPAEDTDITEPSALITFPWRQSSTQSGSIIVRGTASDATGIKTVRVNGLEAMLSQPSNVAPSFSSFSGSRKTATGSFSTGVIDDTSDGETVEWQVEIELDDVNTELVVDVENVSDISNQAADTASIKRLLVPSEFTFDAVKNRVLGISVTENFDRVVVDYDFTTGDQVEYAVLSDRSDMKSCYNAVSDKLYFFTYEDENRFDFYQLDLASSEIEKLVDYTYDPVGSGFLNGVFQMGIHCASGAENLYVDSQYFSEDSDSNQINIHSINLDELPSISDFYIQSQDTRSELSMRLLMDGVLLSSTYQLGIIPFNSGELTPLLVNNDFGSFPSIVEGSTADQVYVVSYDGVKEILVSSSTMSNFSPQLANDPLAFSQIRDSALDVAGNRILVSDSDLDAIIAVDLDSGERSIALSSGLGDGPKIIAPRAIAYSAAGSTVYLADDGGNASEKIIAVDLETGNRTWLGDVNDQFNVFLNGIDIDEANGLLYVSSESKVYRVDIESGETETIASEQAGSGTVMESYGSLAFDGTNSRLLISDAILEAIVQIDLVTYERSIVSQSGVKGEGETFENINGLALDEENQLAYVTNQRNGALQVVDLATGNRENISTSCQDLGAEETIVGLTLSLDKKSLIVQDTQLYRINLEGEDTCEEMPNTLSTLSASSASGDQLFIGEFGALYYYDYNTSQKVIISK